MFLNSLKKGKKLHDWQFTQADNAVKFYSHHFLSEFSGDAKLSQNNLGADPLIRKHFQQNSVFNASIQNMRFMHP